MTVLVLFPLLHQHSSYIFLFSGGCDGCLNVNNPDNAGLADLVDSLDTVYTTNDYDTVLSRADFWALAGVYGVDKTIELNNDDCEEDDCAVPDSGLVFKIVTLHPTLMLMFTFHQFFLTIPVLVTLYKYPHTAIFTLFYYVLKATEVTIESF